MKQETCLKNKMSYSRRKARRFWKQTYSDLPRDIIVHHKDGDPFNNNPDNLTIMENGEHLSYHASISDKKAMNNDKLLLKLESLLTIFNDR